MNGIELVRSRVLRIGRRLAPVLDEVVVRVVLGDARAAVAVGDEVRPVRQPGDVRRSVEGVRPAAAYAKLALAVDQLSVVGEAIDHVELVVDDPDVLLGIVGTDLDLVRAATARQLAEHFVEMRPLVDQVALAVDDQDRVLKPPFPSALRPPARRWRRGRRRCRWRPSGGLSATYGVHGAAPLGSGSSPRIAIQIRSGFSA